MLHECYMLRQARPGMAGCLREDADRPADELAVWLAPQLQEASRAASQLGPTPRNRARAAVEGAKATRLQNHEAGFQCNKQKRRYKKQFLQASMQARILASRGRCHSRRLCPLRLCVRGAATSHARTRPPSPATPCPCCHLLSTTARQKPKLSCSILLPRVEQNKRLGSQGRGLFTMLAVMVRRALRHNASHQDCLIRLSRRGTLWGRLSLHCSPIDVVAQNDTWLQFPSLSQAMHKLKRVKMRGLHRGTNLHSDINYVWAAMITVITEGLFLNIQYLTLTPAASEPCARRSGPRSCLAR